MDFSTRLLLHREQGSNEEAAGGKDQGQSRKQTRRMRPLGWRVPSRGAQWITCLVGSDSEQVVLLLMSKQHVAPGVDSIVIRACKAPWRRKFIWRVIMHLKDESARQTS